MKDQGWRRCFWKLGEFQDEERRWKQARWGGELKMGDNEWKVLTCGKDGDFEFFYIQHYKDCSIFYNYFSWLQLYYEVLSSGEYAVRFSSYENIMLFFNRYRSKSNIPHLSLIHI